MGQNTLKKFGINEEGYTFHSFRRSGATTLADSDLDITNLKRVGRWKSTSVAESYIYNCSSLAKNQQSYRI